jgi:hypothetical protein
MFSQPMMVQPIIQSISVFARAMCVRKFVARESAVFRFWAVEFPFHIVIRSRESSLQPPKSVLM